MSFYTVLHYTALQIYHHNIKPVITFFDKRSKIVILIQNVEKLVAFVCKIQLFCILWFLKDEALKLVRGYRLAGGYVWTVTLCLQLNR